MDCLSGAAVAISDELVSSITQVVNLFLDRKCPNRLGEYIASTLLTPLVKPCGGIRPIATGTVWRRSVSKVSAIMIGHSFDGYLDGLQFGVGVTGGSEAILHSVNRLIEACGKDVGLSMTLVDFKNAFNLVDREVMLREVRLRCPAISRWQSDPLGPLLFSLVLHPLICKIRDSFSLSLHAWYLDDGTIVEDTVVVGNVLELIIEDGPGLTTLPFAFGGLGVYSAGDVLNYAFLASRLPSAVLPTKLLRHTGIVSLRPIFDDALSVFNTSMEIDLLINPSIPLFSVSKPCSACSKVFARDIYGYHAVSCDGIISIKHRHNIVPDTLVDICYRSGISAGKEVDIELDGGRDKPLRLADMLLYSWDGGLDRKRTKYMAKCATIGYGFLPFSFSSLGELEADMVTLLKRIRKFSMAQDIGARAAVHIFNRIIFAIAKGVPFAIVESIVDEVTSQSSTTFCFPKGTSCGRDGLRAQHLMDILGGAASAVVDDLLGSITWVVNLWWYTPYRYWYNVAKAASSFIGISMNTYLHDFQFDIGVPASCKIVLLVNRLIESKGNEVRSSILLVDFKNAFNLVNLSILLEETKFWCPSITPWVKLCYARPPRLYYDDSILWSCQGVQQGDPLGPLMFSLTLYPLVQTINQSRKLTRLAWYLDGGTIVGDTLMVAKALDIIRTDVRLMLDGLGILFAGDIIRITILMYSGGSARVSMRIGWTNKEIMWTNVLFGIMVRKKAPIGFLSDNGKDLRPTYLLLFNWLQGKDAWLDVTDISPFSGMRSGFMYSERSWSTAC
ncbi:putative reverse transcriptase domain-containing protein [Tanacetum coccineum]